jgi:hypothetical protein
MGTETFFDPTIYANKSILKQSPDLAPPRASLGTRHRVKYVNVAANTAAAFALTGLLSVPPQTIASTVSLQQVVPPVVKGKPVLAASAAAEETVDHRPVQMKPRRVLVFRQVVQVRRATPAPFAEAGDGE